MAPKQSRLSRTVRMLELNLDQEIAGHAVVRGTRACPGDVPLRGLTLQFRAARSDLPSDLARTEAVYGVPGCRPRLGPGLAESGQRRKPSRLADGIHALSVPTQGHLLLAVMGLSRIDRFLNGHAACGGPASAAIGGRLDVTTAAANKPICSMNMQEAVAFGASACRNR